MGEGMRIADWKDGAQGTNIIGEFCLFDDKTGFFMNFLKIIRSKKGSLFLAMPNKGIKDEMGQTTWVPYYGYSEQRSRSFQEKVLELAKPFTEKKNYAPPPPLPPMAREENLFSQDF